MNELKDITCLNVCEATGLKTEIKRLKAEVEKWKQLAIDAAVAKTEKEACKIVRDGLCEKG